jgi:hydroxymethylpyrimidine pyrophosphatase-like HAD family hydrolase
MSLSTSKIKTIREYLTSKYGNELEVSYTHPLLLEVTKKGVNKGYAILKMANQLNIKRENIVCVGDSGNDIPMAKVSGKSFGLKSRNKQLMKNVDVYLKNKTNAIAKIIDNYLIDNGIELIVSDLDGTLLDNYTKLVHTDTAHVLKKAMHEKGCKFAIATGRGLDDCLLVFKGLHLKPQNNLYVIGTNGSFVFDCTT